jgi:hypothetical protein
MLTVNWRPVRVVTAGAGIVLTCGLAACGTKVAAASGPPAAPGASRAAQAPGTATSPGGIVPPPSAPPASPGSSAAGQLAAFLAAAAGDDAQLKRAAVLVNRQIGPDVIRFPAAEVSAVNALPGYAAAAAKAIPGRLPPELLRRVMLAYSDLESRTAAFRAVSRYVPASGTLSATSDDGRALVQGVNRGAPAAARFAGDLAAVRELAAATSPLAPTAPGARASAEVAVRVARINSANTGCASTGGWVATSLAPLTWDPRDIGRFHADGTVDTIPFSATYQPGGWRVMLYVC